MKSKSKLILIYFSTVIVTLFSIQLEIQPSQASQQVCNRNPGQEKDTSTIRSNSVKVQGYILKVQLRYNNKTNEKWSRACIPAGTTLYLKDKSGQIYGAYSAQVNGWNYGDKVQNSNPMKACAKYPNDPREFCTSFN
jgi:hypothetical protein